MLQFGILTLPNPHGGSWQRGDLIWNRSQFWKWKGGAERGEEDNGGHIHWAWIRYLTKILKPCLWPQVATPKPAIHGIATWGWFQIRSRSIPVRAQVTVPSVTAATNMFTARYKNKKCLRSHYSPACKVSLGDRHFLPGMTAARQSAQLLTGATKVFEQLTVEPPYLYAWTANGPRTVFRRSHITC